MALLSQLKPQMLGEGERDVNRRFYFPRNHWGFRVEIEQRCIDHFNIYILEKERVTSDEYRSKSMTDLWLRITLRLRHFKSQDICYSNSSTNRAVIPKFSLVGQRTLEHWIVMYLAQIMPRLLINPNMTQCPNYALDIYFDKENEGGAKSPGLLNLD